MALAITVSAVLKLPKLKDVAGSRKFFKASPEDEQVDQYEGTRKVPATVETVGTKYWSAPGAEFIPYNPDTDSVHLSSIGVATTDGNGIQWICAVHLPQGAKITSAVVNGSDSTQTWNLMRNTHSGTEAFSNNVCISFNLNR